MTIDGEKVYAVKFMRYTNSCNDTVSDWDGKSSDHTDDEYYYVGLEPFLVRETDLEYFRRFGGGFRSINFVGNLGSPKVKLPEDSLPKSETVVYTSQEVPSFEFPRSVSSDVIIPTVFNQSSSSPEKDLGEYFQVNYSKDTTTTTTFSNNEQ